MSRGHGKVERAILDFDLGGQLVPLMEIARDAGYDIHRRSTEQSFRRALENLYCSQHLVDYQWVRHGKRVSACVRPAGPDLDDSAAVERLDALFPPEPSMPEADYLLAMIRSGKYMVCDVETGGTVDHVLAWKKTCWYV